jgi:hypothetical protein
LRIREEGQEQVGKNREYDEHKKGATAIYFCILKERSTEISVEVQEQLGNLKKILQDHELLVQYNIALAEEYLAHSAQ